jgi:hypothetical protein
MKQTLSDLSAAYAVLGQLGQSAPSVGEVVTGPRSDLVTEIVHKGVVGIGQVTPPGSILTGAHGRIHVDPLLTGTGGVSYSDGGFTDPAVNLSGVPVDAFLALLGSGTVHRVTAAGAARLDVSPALPIPQPTTRWFVSTDAPGLQFKDTTRDFWQAFTGGETASTIIASGTTGLFPPRVLASGVVTARIIDSTHGEPWPYERSGSAGLVGPSTSEVTLASLLQTWGVSTGWGLFLHGASLNPAGELRTIRAVLSETDLTVSSAFSATSIISSWAVYRWATIAQVLGDTTVSLLDAGIQPGWSVYVDGTGPYIVGSVLDDHTLRLTASQPSHATGISWYVLLPTDEVYDASATFQSSGIVAGSVLHINGTPFTVAEVISQTRLRLTTPWTQSSPSGDAWFWYESTDLTRLFEQRDGADLSAVAPVMGGEPVTLEISGDVVPFLRPSGTTSLDLARSVPVVGTPGLPWSLRRGDGTLRLSDFVNAPFAGLGVGTRLVVFPGTAESVEVRIDQVLNPAEVLVSRPLPQGRSSITYAVYDPVYPGHELVYAGLRYQISTILDGRLHLAKPLPFSAGIDLPYFIVESGAPAESHALFDPVGALSYDPAGFDDDLVGATVRLNASPATSARVVVVADSDLDGVNDTLVLDVFLPSGLKSVGYQVWVEAEGSTPKVSLPGVIPTPTGSVLSLWSPRVDGAVLGASVGGGSTTLTLQRVVSSGLEDVLGVLTRGGAPSYGLWLLFAHLLDAVELPDTRLRRLSATTAKAIEDRGVAGALILTGVTATLLDDGDGDATTPRARLSAPATGVRVGDRLTLGVGLVTYVTSVEGAYVSFGPEIDINAVLTTCEVHRTSVSEAIYEATAVRDAVTPILDACAGFTVTPSASVRAAVALLVDNGLDRSVDKLRAGDLPGLATASRTAATYAGHAADSARGVGRDLASPDAYADTHNVATGDGYALLGQLDATHQTIGQAAEALRADEITRSIAAASAEDARNRAVYSLTGETVSGSVSEQDPTLPWIAQTGSAVDRVNRVAENVKATLQYILDHPDEFEEIT